MSWPLVLPIECCLLLKSEWHWVQDPSDTSICAFPEDSSPEPQAAPPKDVFCVVPLHQVFPSSQSCYNNALRVGVIPLSKTFPETPKIASSQFLTVLCTFQATHELHVCGMHLEQGFLLFLSIWQIKLQPKKFLPNSISLLARCEVNLSKWFKSKKGAVQPLTRMEYFVVEAQSKKAHIGVRRGVGELMKLEFSWNSHAQYPYYSLVPPPFMRKVEVDTPVQAALSSSLTTIMFISELEISILKSDKLIRGLDLTASFKLNQNSQALRELEEEEACSEQENAKNEMERPCAPEPIQAQKVLKVASDTIEPELGISALVSLTQLASGQMVLRTTPYCSPACCKGSILNLEPLGLHEYLVALHVLANQNLAIRVVFELKVQLFRIDFFVLELDMSRKISIKLHTRLYRRNVYQISINLVSGLNSQLFLSNGVGDKYSLMISRQELKYPLIIHFDWDRDSNKLEFEDQCYQLAPTNLPTTYVSNLSYATLPSANAITDQISKVALTMQNKECQVAAGISLTGSTAALVLVGKGLYSLLQG